MTNEEEMCSESESYIPNDAQSASLSLNKAPVWGLRPHFYCCQTVAGFLMWGALPDKRRICRLQLLLALASADLFGSDSRGTRDHILLSQSRDFPFRRLLRLAGLRWRYSTPPPHGMNAFFSARPFIQSPVTMENVCCLSVDTENAFRTK
jgi:hypothetical protein